MESVPRCCAPVSQINITEITFAIEVSDLFSINVRDLPLSSHRGCGLSETGSAFLQKEKRQGAPSLQLVKASEGKARTYIQRTEIETHTLVCLERGNSTFDLCTCQEGLSVFNLSWLWKQSVSLLSYFLLSILAGYKFRASIAACKRRLWTGQKNGVSHQNTCPQWCGCCGEKLVTVLFQQFSPGLVKGIHWVLGRASWCLVQLGSSTCIGSALTLAWPF